MPSQSTFWNVGCILGASGVMLGAFGAHGLRKIITDVAKIKSWETAAHYQIIHSLAIIISALPASSPGQYSTLPSYLFTIGTSLFSGSIYLLVLNPTRFKFLGPVTPMGGMCLIAGWLSMLGRFSGNGAGALKRD